MSFWDHVIPWDEVRRGEEKLFFHHVPRTAGTSLSHKLRETIPSYRWLHVDELLGAMQAGFMYVNQAGAPVEAAALGGHCHLSDGRWRHVPDHVRFISFCVLRDPVRRVISAYHYLRRRPDHPQHGIAKRYTIREIYQYGLGRALQINDGASSVLTDVRSDRQMLSQARRALRRYTFFGLFEELEGVARLLRRTMRFESEFFIPNLGRGYEPPPPPTELDEDTLKAIKMYNWRDEVLYTCAQEEYRRRAEEEWGIVDRVIVSV